MEMSDGPKAYFDFLKSAVRDGGSASFEEVSRHARSRDLELQSPAMAALVAWAEMGLDRIAEIALSQDSSKATSAALKVLASLAAQKAIDETLLFIIDSELLSLINELAIRFDLKALAQEKLHELVAATRIEDLLIPLGVSLSQMSLVDPQIAAEVVSAISTKWLHFGPKTISAYNNLIVTHPANEPIFHTFFEDNPQFLDPMAIHIWSKPDLHGILEPDFVIRRADNTYLIVEIECPSKPLITRGNQLSAEATHAEKQTTDYRTFLNERILDTRRHFPAYREPECMAVIGLQSGLSPDQRIALAASNGARHNLRTVGFDWLSERAASILTNMSGNQPDVVRRYRFV